MFGKSADRRTNEKSADHRTSLMPFRGYSVDLKKYLLEQNVSNDWIVTGRLMPYSAVGAATFES